MPNISSHYFTPQAPLEAVGEVHSIKWNESTFRFATGNGVFAKSGLDAGSRLLLQMALPSLSDLPDDSLIGDLGCGWGAVGCVLAHELPRMNISMNDVNPRAVALARNNAELNHLENTFCWCGDGLSAVADNRFAAILCNPPIRAGNDVMARLFEDSLRCLSKSGNLYLVIRTAQGAKSWQKRLKVLFGNCDLLEIKSGYRVLRCERKIG
ncbi:MAG: methyltransferase [Abditibacteriaceae bacterium]